MDDDINLISSLKTHQCIGDWYLEWPATTSQNKICHNSCRKHHFRFYTWLRTRVQRGQCSCQGPEGEVSSSERTGRISLTISNVRHFLSEHTYFRPYGLPPLGDSPLWGWILILFVQSSIWIKWSWYQYIYSVIQDVKIPIWGAKMIS